MLRRLAHAASTLTLLRRIAPAPTGAGLRALAGYALLRLRMRRVRGFCTFRQGVVLYWLARFHRPAGPIVEIGSWTGTSTVVLARGGRSAVVAVDPHAGVGMTEPRDTWQEFQENVRRFHASVDARREPSVDAAARYDGPPIALLYVDGWHAYEAVVEDIEAWLPHVAPDGVIVFDDYTDLEWGVGRAVDERVDSGALERLGTTCGYALTRPGRAPRPAPAAPPAPGS